MKSTFNTNTLKTFVGPLSAWELHLVQNNRRAGVSIERMVEIIKKHRAERQQHAHLIAEVDGGAV